MNTDIYSELNSLIGTTINKEVKFYTFYEDWSNVTEEELNEYEIEVHEEVNISIGGEITMSGFIYYDEPILSKGYPMTCGWLSQSDDEQLYTDVPKKYLIRNIIHIGTVIVIPGSPVEPSGFLIDSSDILYYNDRKFLSIFTKCKDRE